MTRWYSNKASTAHANESKPVVMAQPIKKPRATNALELFAQSHRDELRVATSSRIQKDGSTSTPGGHLLVYRDVKRKAFKGQSEADRSHWETLAQEQNAKVSAPPTADYFYK
jgi:hypothetical protein